MKSNNLQKMLNAVVLISKERGWEKFHAPKNVAMDLVRESSEALEHFIWDSNEEILKDKKRIEKIRMEMADVLHSLLILSYILKIDLSESFWEKLEEVKKRYPVSKVYGKSGYTNKF